MFKRVWEKAIRERMRENKTLYSVDKPGENRRETGDIGG